VQMGSESCTHGSMQVLHWEVVSVGLRGYFCTRDTLYKMSCIVCSFDNSECAWLFLRPTVGVGTIMHHSQNIMQCMHVLSVFSRCTSEWLLLRPPTIRAQPCRHPGAPCPSTPHGE
jgi:hypothetical protein